MAVITREYAEALIQEQVSATIMQEAPQSSVMMQMMRRLPNMTSGTTRLPVVDVLPLAYWVGGDTGYKQTSRQAWDNVYINAGELAVIVPIPEAVVADASFDIMGQVVPSVVEAIGKAFDEAVLFGINRPPEWDLDIVTRARQAGNNVSGSSIDYDTFLGEGGVISKVEESGHMVTGGVASMAVRAKLRGIKDEVGRPIFTSSMQDRSRYELDGSPLFFPLNGSFDASIAQLIVGDFSQAVFAIRQDVTTKILTESVIQDPATKAIVYNLAQQDMIALRVTFRAGWAMPNPATRMDGDRVKVPFAYLEPASPVTTYTMTVTVNDSDSDPVAGVIVSVNGARLKTNASGQVVFNLRNGTYDYKVLGGDSYRNAAGTKTISGSNVTETVTLVSKS